MVWIGCLMTAIGIRPANHEIVRVRHPIEDGTRPVASKCSARGEAEHRAADLTLQPRRGPGSRLGEPRYHPFLSELCSPADLRGCRGAGTSAAGNHDGWV